MNSSWPPVVVKLADWHSGAGVAVVCHGLEHRVIRHDGRVVALDHPGFDSQVAASEATHARGGMQRLGFRYVDTGFNTEAMKRGRPKPRWIPPNIKTRSLSQGSVSDPDGLAACVRLAVEGFVPCSWCGRLLAEGNVCTAEVEPYCTLANGNGWRQLIPPGWIHSKYAGIPTGFGRGWPDEYTWQRNSPLERHDARFLASPWWPDLHPRRFAVLACLRHSEQGGTYKGAFQAVMDLLTDSLGEPRPAPKGKDSRQDQINYFAALRRLAAPLANRSPDSGGQQ
jgi:hypothetical protein